MMYALAQPGGKEPFTYGGKMVLHGNLMELEFLFPNGEFIRLEGNSPGEIAQRTGIPCMLLKNHPDMGPVEFPINPREFIS